MGLLQYVGCIGIHNRKLRSSCYDPYLGPSYAEQNGLKSVMLLVCHGAPLLDVRQTTTVDSHWTVSQSSVCRSLSIPRWAEAEGPQERAAQS